jgi:hypothetical protein
MSLTIPALENCVRQPIFNDSSIGQDVRKFQYEQLLTGKKPMAV